MWPPSRHVDLRGLYAFRIRNYTEAGTQKIVDISPREIPEYSKRRTNSNLWFGRSWKVELKIKYAFSLQKTVLFFI